MELQRLSLTNFRAFKQAEFEFKPGMNLIVGINGVGKSSVLDAIRFILAQTLPKISLAKSNSKLTISESDITIGSENLSAELGFILGEQNFTCTAIKVREKYSTETRAETSDDEFSNQLDRKKRIDLRRNKYRGVTQIEGYFLNPDEKKVLSKQKNSKEQPLAVFFSTRRSVPNGSAPSKASTSVGQSAAFADALAERELRWREFAEWWQVQVSLAEETGKSRFGKNLQVLSETVTRFLGDVKNLRAITDPKPTLLLEKNGVTLDINFLSDGERGMISLVLDLAKRLSLANPELKNPLDGEAIVLIDELDLHLHPRWQREVVGKLTRTFPNCQFIVTTHSPQIVGEVSPENIIILEEGKQPYCPDQSFGMDTNWILEFLMGTHSRNPEFEQKLNMISDLIEDNELEKAQNEIDLLKNNNLTRDPELVRLQSRLARFKLLKDNPEEN